MEEGLVSSLHILQPNKCRLTLAIFCLHRRLVLGVRRFGRTTASGAPYLLWSQFAHLSLQEITTCACLAAQEIICLADINRPGIHRPALFRYWKWIGTQKSIIQYLECRCSCRQPHNNLQVTTQLGNSIGKFSSSNSNIIGLAEQYQGDSSRNSNIMG